MIFRYFGALCFAAAALGQAVANNSNPPAADTKTAGDAARDSLAAAKTLLNEGKAGEAVTAFKAIVEKNPASAEAQAGFVRSLLRSHQVNEADEAAKKALAAVPTSALVHAAAGDVDFREGKFGEAEAEYRAALKIDSTSARATFGMARIMYMVSMRKSSVAALTKAHDLDPADEQISNTWISTLPRAQQLAGLTKKAGDHPSEREVDEIRFLTAVVQKQPWVLTTGIKRTEINMVMVGAKLAWTSDINSSTGTYGPMNVRKGYGLPVKFNDRTSADLLLDTGAERIVIGRKLAEKAGVVKIADSSFSGIGDKGPVQGYVGWVDKIKIGEVEFKDCIVEVSNGNNVADESGLIGADVFDKFLITIDFRERKLILAPLPQNPAAPLAAANDDSPQDRYIAPEMRSFIKVFIIDDHLFAPVVVNDKAVGNFMLDTGADMNTMSPSFATQVTKASNDQEYTMKGISGKVEHVLTGQKAILQIGKMRLESHDLPVFATKNQSDGFGIEIAGFIGIRSLSQMKMTIDYRDGLVNLDVYEFKPARE